MIAMRSASSSASSRKCVVRMMVLPSLCARSSCQMARRECGSMPEVGSSRKMLRESPMSEMAKQSLRFCPPESCHASASARCVRPTLESISPTADSRLSPLRPLSEPKRRRWRRGERESKTTFVCGQTPTESLMARMCVRMESPSTVASPAEGGMRPVSIEMVVVLPAPFAPSSAEICPERSSRSRPCTATPLSNTFRSPRVRTHPAPSGSGGSGSSASGGGGACDCTLGISAELMLKLLEPKRLPEETEEEVENQYEDWKRNHGLRWIPNSDGMTWSRYHASAV
mmetsp:Transcript_15258/g.32477  ORF Transcript_15258/g.32477 Transcript_15258/m.32477 type:complete len:285 (+) Transcript_15258:1877-2731(+)